MAGLRLCSLALLLCAANALATQFTDYLPMGGDEYAKKRALRLLATVTIAFYRQA